MKTLVLTIPGQPPLPLAGEGQSWTFGRSPENDVPIPEASLSRRHARISLKEGVPYLEDLGSRNGTCLNGERISGLRALREEDEILLGLVSLKLGAQAHGPRVRIDATGDASAKASQVIALDTAHQASTFRVRAETLRLREVMRGFQALSLELLKDSPPEELFAHLLDSLWNLLDPWRAAVLILDAGGNLSSVASRGAGGARPILLAQGLVDAALERRESLLYNDRSDDGALASVSLVRSGVTSAMVTPMEHRGVVKGLLYLDSQPPHPPFDEEALRLASTLAHLATAKLEQARVREEELARKQVDQELALARHIQQGLLPAMPPAIPGYEVQGNNLPSRQVSGDLFGWWEKGDGRWLFCLADVSGKGLGPGLLMASLQATLEAWTERDLPVSDLSFQLSRTLARHTDGRRFVTAFLAVLDPATGEVAFTNAGHNPALHIRRSGAVDTLGAHGLPLAMLPGNPYGEGVLRLEPGELLALYTDGITETTDPAGEEFGQEALARFLADRRGEALPVLEARLMGELDRFSRGAPYLDDRTLVMVRRTETA